jgi:ribose-phosphate pyrophosphokinase
MRGVNNKMLLISGPALQELGKNVAELLKTNTVNVVFKRFPDGENYVRLEGSVKNEEVAIVQTTSPPQDTHLLQLFLLADLAKDLGAKKVTAVVPYLAYSRQDKRFLPGEAWSIETIAKLMKTAGVDQLVTINVHANEILKKFPFPAKSISAMPLLAEYFKKMGLEGAFALAPDEGAKEYAIVADRILHGGYGWRHKMRDRYTGEIGFRNDKFDVKGKDAIIFDDIISTGGTTAAAVKMLKNQGAKRVYSACVHPLLIGDAEKRILENGAEAIVGTDCVPSHVSKVSVAPLIADALGKKEA